MKSRSLLLVSAIAAVAIVGFVGAAVVMAPPDSHGSDQKSRHVLLLSVDGMHQQDLDWYVKNNPQSSLALLLRYGTSYTQAMAPVPTDSFPGLIAQVTGGHPKTTGIYYDHAYNRALLPAGTKKCDGVKLGAEVEFTEAANRDPKALDAGEGLSGLPDNILSMNASPQSLLEPAKLPVDPVTCAPVYPHEYLNVNTIFEVAKAAGMTTAWADKHPVYEILNGPSGTGVDDLFTPESDSDAPAHFAGTDWTKDTAATKQYDNYKVEALLRQISGRDRAGSKVQPVPAIFGMSFQAVNAAQKLPSSNGMEGGYLSGGLIPGALLKSSLDFIDASMARIIDAIQQNRLDGSTTIIFSAKHGQSPTDPDTLIRVPDKKIIKDLNAAWKDFKPTSTTDLVAFSSEDDVLQLWLSDRSREAVVFAKKFLEGYIATGNKIDGTETTVRSAGLSKIYEGAKVAKYFGSSRHDNRSPDILGIAQKGVVFTGGKAKIAEHGGANPADRNVPLVVSRLSRAQQKSESATVQGKQGQGSIVAERVETTQIAPTILHLLGLDPNKLQAVRIEDTRVLPGVR